MAAADNMARLKCPTCGREFEVSGLAAIGVSDGEERPCSWECRGAGGGPE